MANPSQTPDYQRQRDQLDMKFSLRILLLVALLAGGMLVSFSRESLDRIAWVGIALVLLSVLIAVGWVIKARAWGKNEVAMRESGTVELITAAFATVNTGRIVGGLHGWDLASEMQIRLDSGHTFRGSYHAFVGYYQLQKWWRRAFKPEAGRLTPPFPKDPREARDAIFHVGASWQCECNPTNPDQVVVFPFAAAGERVKYDVRHASGPDYVCFYSAT